MRIPHSSIFGIHGPCVGSISLQCIGVSLEACYKNLDKILEDDHLDKLSLHSLHMRTCIKQCYLFKLLHGLSILPNSAIITFTFHSYHTHSNHNLSLHVPSSHTNAYYYSFLCDVLCLNVLYVYVTAWF